MKVKKFIKWLKNYQEYEIDVVHAKVGGEEIELTYMPIDTSFVSGNIHVGLQEIDNGEDVKFLRLGAIEEINEEKPTIIVPKDISLVN